MRYPLRYATRYACEGSLRQRGTMIKNGSSILSIT